MKNMPWLFGPCLMSNKQEPFGPGGRDFTLPGSKEYRETAFGSSPKSLGDTTAICRDCILPHPKPMETRWLSFTLTRLKLEEGEQRRVTNCLITISHCERLRPFEYDRRPTHPRLDKLALGTELAGPSRCHGC